MQDAFETDVLQLFNARIAATAGTVGTGAAMTAETLDRGPVCHGQQSASIATELQQLEQQKVALEKQLQALAEKAQEAAANDPSTMDQPDSGPVVMGEEPQPDSSGLVETPEEKPQRPRRQRAPRKPRPAPDEGNAPEAAE